VTDTVRVTASLPAVTVNSCSPRKALVE